jgi:GT2 family glycosyltransferase
MDISVVILSYNTRDLLRACLRSVAADAGGFAVETLVVDNGSTDGSGAMVREEFPGVRLIESQENLGFAGGNNLAFLHCAGRYVLLLNSDAELHRGALGTLAGYLDAHPRVGAVGARLLNTDGTWQPSAFGFPTLGRMALATTRLSVLLGGNAEPGRTHRPRAPLAVDWVTAACLMVRRSVIAAVGPLDERFFLDYEDVDWCRRIRDAGWEIHAVPAAVATHHRWRSKAQLGEQWLFGDESACRYFRKHHGARAEQVIRSLFVGFHLCGWAKCALRAALTGDATDRMKRDRHRRGVARFAAGAGGDGSRRSSMPAGISRPPTHPSEAPDPRRSEGVPVSMAPDASAVNMEP